MIIIQNTKKQKLNIYYIFIILSLLFQSLAVILGKFASLYMDKFNLLNIISNPYYIISLFFLGLQAIIWPIALQKIPLFFAYLIMSLVYVVILFASLFIFKEKISLMNILGTILIIIGVLIVTLNQGKKND